MPDEQAPAAQTETPAPSTEVTMPTLDSLSAEDYAKWEKTGELPNWPPKEESAPSTETQGAEAPAVETAPAPEPEAKEEPKPEAGKGVKARNAKLDQEIQELQVKLARRHELRQELERGETKPAPPAAETPAKVPEGKPVFESFLADAESYEEAIEKYQDARDAWNRQQWRTEQEQEASQKTAREHAARLQEKLLEAEAAHEDYDAVMNSPAVKSIRFATAEAKGALEAYLARKSEHPGELLYHLGKNPDQFRKIANADALTVIAELAKIEAGLNGKAGPVAAPQPKRHSDAPPPVTELAARTSAAGDEIEEALVTKNYELYERTANAREMAARKRA